MATHLQQRMQLGMLLLQATQVTCQALKKKKVKKVGYVYHARCRRRPEGAMDEKSDAGMDSDEA
jgi:hypothetical protein